MDAEKWTNQQIELARVRTWRAIRERQIEHEAEANQSNDQANRRMDMLGVYGTGLIFALVICALGLAWYADKLGWAK